MEEGVEVRHRTERAARSTRYTWRRSSSLATRYDYPSRVEIFPRPDICSISPDTITTRHSSRPRTWFRALTQPFLDGHAPSPSDGAVYTYIWADSARCARPWGSVLVRSRGFTPRAPSALGTKGAPSSLRGSADYLLWEEMSLSSPYEHHHDLAYAPSSPIDLPYPSLALIVAARLDLPICALLLRVVVSPVCSAPRLRMCTPYRRTCTVCVRIPVRIPLHLPKHRLRKQDRVVEHDHLYPRLVSRRGWEDLMLMRALRHHVLLRCSLSLAYRGRRSRCGCRRGNMCGTSRGMSGTRISADVLQRPRFGMRYVQGQAGEYTEVRWDVLVSAAPSC
ncbi:hypothetical protein B0H10DRAFT_1250806 [Mycena sp. CBHHK59/15]|nr:hypothetical protein B0H10DRAFT_1250806 [Mycena sp. CBHHK59/15]